MTGNEITTQNTSRVSETICNFREKHCCSDIYDHQYVDEKIMLIQEKK